MERKHFIQILRKSPFLFKKAALVLRYMNPHLSYCEKCGLPWNWCESKSVPVSKHISTFATCDYCWHSSTLNELKTYYTSVYEKQKESVERAGYVMEHSLDHLLKAVEIEYTRSIINIFKNTVPLK